ncbi:hypothetical protein GW17_00023536, partial [Ensete ventricosum]
AFDLYPTHPPTCLPLLATSNLHCFFSVTCVCCHSDSSSSCESSLSSPISPSFTSPSLLLRYCRCPLSLISLFLHRVVLIGVVGITLTIESIFCSGT